MHESAFVWCDDQIQRLGLTYRPTLEIGSFYANGSVRALFSGRYVGVDYRNGLCVDVVADGESLPFADESWEVVISAETLEHVARPWLLLNEAARVCRPGGWVIMTARGFDDRGAYPVHNYPFDYWRFNRGAVDVLVRDAGLAMKINARDPDKPGFFLLAQRPVVEPG